MADKIEWITDFKKAFDEANEKKKPVMLDFFNPQ